MKPDARELRFQKYTALGNDYIVLDEREHPINLDASKVVALCDRRFGIGGDGILIHQVPKLGGSHRVKIFNSDGSECERSGNGLRIFAQWLIDNTLESDGAFSVACHAGPSDVQVNPDGSLTVEISKASFDSNIIGILDPEVDCRRYILKSTVGDLDVTSVSVGNPHTTVFTPIRPEDQRVLGKEIAENPLYKIGTNVQFVKSASGQDLSIEIWERGSGMTLASGSSACAASAAAIQRGLVTAPVVVRMPGGTVDVFLKDGVIWQTGKVRRVFAGTLDAF